MQVTGVIASLPQDFERGLRFVFEVEESGMRRFETRLERVEAQAVAEAIARERRFDRDLKKAKKRGKDLDRLWCVVEILARGERLAPRHRPHKHSGAPPRPSHAE